MSPSQQTQPTQQTQSAVYLNPLTDYGFKKIFGETASKPALLDFLNAVLPARHQLIELESINTVYGAIIEVYAKTPSGDLVYVELSIAKGPFIKGGIPRVPFFHLAQQASRRQALKALYSMNVFDIVIDLNNNNNNNINTAPATERVIQHIQIQSQEQSQEQADPSVDYKFNVSVLLMPYFTKQAHELATQTDKWLYLLKNMAACETVPSVYAEDALFKQVFEQATMAALDHDQHTQYRASVHSKAEEVLGLAYAMKSRGFDAALISQSLGLSTANIAAL